MGTTKRLSPKSLGIVSTLVTLAVIGLIVWTVVESVVGFASGGHLDVIEQFRVVVPSGPSTGQSKIVAATVHLSHPSGGHRIVALLRDLAPLLLALAGLLIWSRLENASATVATDSHLVARYLRMLAIVIGLGIPVEVSIARALNDSLASATGVPQQAIGGDHDLLWPCVGLLIYALSRRLSRGDRNVAT